MTKHLVTNSLPVKVQRKSSFSFLPCLLVTLLANLIHWKTSKFLDFNWKRILNRYFGINFSEARNKYFLFSVNYFLQNYFMARFSNKSKVVFTNFFSDGNFTSTCLWLIVVYNIHKTWINNIITTNWIFTKLK